MSSRMPAICASLALALILVRGASAADGGWPQFRGPQANGHAEARDLPLTWGESENVRWKTPIHGRGWSTPAILGEQIWLTTATEDGTEMSVLCLDRESGRILLDRKLFTNENPEPLGNDVNGYASPSPAIEDGRVYIHFGSYGTACLDTQTLQTLWTRRDLPCRHYRGPSSSPILFENLVILTFDGVDLQYLAALDKKTGQTVWKTDRTAEWDDIGPDGLPEAEGDRRKAHSTPIVVEVQGRPILISAGAKAAYGYDPRTGKELWKLAHKGFSSSLAPIDGEGLVYLATGYGGEYLAVRPDSGEVAWRYAKNVPRKPTPVLVNGLLYLVDDSGVATCLDSKTGEEVWKERIGGQYSASPLYADGRIYVASEQGRCLALAPGRKLEILAESSLPDGFMASPVAVDRALYLRSKTALYRIEKPADAGRR